MRVVLYAGAHDDELFRYIDAWVSSRHADTVVVRVDRRARESLRRKWARKLRLQGAAGVITSATGVPLQRLILRRDHRLAEAAIAGLPRPATRGREIRPAVPSANGPEAVALLRRLEPEVLIQAGAGILREQVFGLPTRATLNLHHGIAPRIRGVSSLHWALFAARPEWVGATVHRVDAGIDTGAVLAYAPVAVSPGDRFPDVFARVTERGVAALIQVLDRIAAGDDWAVPAADGPGHYRSAIDGWRLLTLELRHRLRSAPPARPPA